MFFELWKWLGSIQRSQKNCYFCLYSCIKGSGIISVNCLLFQGALESMKIVLFFSLGVLHISCTICEFVKIKGKVINLFYKYINAFCCVNFVVYITFERIFNFKNRFSLSTKRNILLKTLVFRFAHRIVFF